MFVAEVFRTTMKNFESFTGQWRLLSAWCAMLELHLSLNWVAVQLKRSAHFVQRNWHRSPHDRISWFPVTGSLPRKSWYCATVIPAQAGCCCCCCWRPHGLLIFNSFFFKFNNTHQSETLHSNVTLFRLLNYSKSFVNVLLVSAVEGVNHYWTPGIKVHYKNSC